MCKKYLYWTPRVLAILYILFISLFALDVFGGGYGFAELLIALFMHLIPTFILIIILLIAWKWEKVGGVIFIILSIGFTLFFNTYRHPMTLLTISGPVFLIGLLFLANKLEFKKKTVKKVAKVKKKAKKTKKVKKQTKKKSKK